MKRFRGRFVVAWFLLYMNAALLGLALLEQKVLGRSPWLFLTAVPAFFAIAAVLFALPSARPRSGLLPALAVGAAVAAATAAGMWIWIAHAAPG